ncbi:ComEC/Rec2 family competence protein [Moorella sulfitireducens]|uniref:ComEC/Rec2 family competence protein n=1 Tax=Neomoorella sulfitireducens TaxID=2972948 RepID=UPI0021AC3FD9|nr:ComEC/Rec2 family competence protein [Moorella sulfitireducens]
MLRKTVRNTRSYMLFTILAFILFTITSCSYTSGDQIPLRVQHSVPVAETNPASPGTPPPSSARPDVTGVLHVRYLDVGQGDAILVQLPDGKNILIDGGTSEAGPGVVRKLKEYGVKKLDFVIGTHPHEDHIGGLDLVINSFQVGKVYLPRVTHYTDAYRELLLAVKDKGLKVTEAKAGVTLPLEGDVHALLISPIKSSYEDLNDYSAVLHLTFGQTAFLFTGDAGTAAEEEMLAGDGPIKADVLKVAHHGSRYSTGTAFLKAVAPSYAVISVGKGNDYGHPHTQTLQRLRKAGVKIYRTDREGTITAVSDGRGLTIQ